MLKLRLSSIAAYDCSVNAGIGLTFAVSSMPFALKTGSAAELCPVLEFECSQGCNVVTLGH